MDSENTCFSVTVYNLDSSKGVIIGDSVAIPEPFIEHTDLEHDGKVCMQYIMSKKLEKSPPLVITDIFH